jgi:creatinine amidohydrolase
VDDEIEWRRLRADQLRDRASADALVVVPLAALEQHGPHLPVEVDCLLVEAVAKRTAALLQARMPVLVLPVVWTGISEHHMSFGGTVTLGFAAYSALIEGIVASLVRAGFHRILLLNGHGGNDNALRVLVDELQPRLEARLVHLTYWHAAAEAIGPLLEAQDRLLHACEAETSMMLALRPELVAMDRAPEGEQGPPETVERVAAGIYRWRTLAARSASGVIGVPAAATPEKGERLLAAIAETIAAKLAAPGFWDLRHAVPALVPEPLQG